MAYLYFCKSINKKIDLRTFIFKYCKFYANFQQKKENALIRSLFYLSFL